jgi:hypothetical protein
VTNLDGSYKEYEYADNMVKVWDEARRWKKYFMDAFRTHPMGSMAPTRGKDPSWGPLLVNAMSAGISGLTMAIVWDLCDRIDKLFRAELYYMQDPVDYQGRGGPNSNSLAHWFLIQSDLWNYFSAPPGTGGMGGWDTPVRR